MTISVGVLTISTRGFRGEQPDTSGDAIKEDLAGQEFEVQRYEIVSDDVAAIQDRLVRWSDEDKLNVIVTTGGTGLSPYDLTPEATLGVIEREVPGIAEVMRMESLKHTRMAMISRAVAGVRGRTLIVNLPGSPNGVRQCLAIVKPVLAHAAEIIAGEANPKHHRH
ncbi:MAG: Molybdopterin biosynthesis enzyme MoaB [Chloroflexi bacterium]|nr:MAG: Molybdopterin biosynthesis enzyme MoaB [Chloroflexota bacterium]